MEDVQFQKAAIQEMERALLPVVPMTPVKDKRSRLQVVAPYIKNCTVLFPRSGCEQLLGQVFNLGVESHDDLCDGLTYLLQGLANQGLELPKIHWIEVLGVILSQLRCPFLFRFQLSFDRKFSFGEPFRSNGFHSEIMLHTTRPTMNAPMLIMLFTLYDIEYANTTFFKASILLTDFRDQPKHCLGDLVPLMFWYFEYEASTKQQ